jgi:uncharacterized membrane protein
MIMLQLVMLLSILIGTYAGLTLLSMTRPFLVLSRSLRGRISLALLFVFTGVSHFIMPEAMVQLLPPSIPLRLELIYVTGVLEILGAVGLLFPGFERLASVALILFLVAVLPGNIYGAFNRVAFGAHELGPIYLLVRVPFQALLMGWAYYFGIRTLSRPRRGVARAFVRHAQAQK